MKTGADAITHGMVRMAVCFLIIIALLITDKSYIKAGTVVCMVCGGPIIDFFTWLLSGFNIGSMHTAMKVAILIIGCVVLAFGMTIVIRSEAGTGPNDLVAVVISDKSGKKFGIIRMITDCVFVAAGAAFGGKFGIGTLICAFLVGPVADMFMPVSSALVEKGLKLMKIQPVKSEKNEHDRDTDPSRLG